MTLDHHANCNFSTLHEYWSKWINSLLIRVKVRHLLIHTRAVVVIEDQFNVIKVV